MDQVQLAFILVLNPLIVSSTRKPLYWLIEILCYSFSFT
jgi:hypothetical protein